MQNFGYKNLAAICFLTAIIFFISTHYLDTQQKKLSASVLDEIARQEAKTYELAQSVKGSKLTPDLAEFVNDCSAKHRNQFDNDLDRLPSLSVEQIGDLEPLFEACADYFANVKTALVFQLESEIAELDTLVRIAKVSDQDDALSVPIEAWQEYLELEKKLALSLRKQVSSQAKIIALLKEGRSTGDKEVQNLVIEARQLSESAAVTNQQLDSVFVTLAP